ncbi:MAG: hypothetical protein P8Y70_09760 [Candidatus Lokiarchaeota archaeon]
MTKEEFFNFLSLTSAFRDVVIGEEYYNQEKDLNINIPEKNSNSELNEEKEFFNLNNNTEDQSIDKDLDELDPKEWDPW